MNLLSKKKLGISWVQGELSIAFFQGQSAKNAWYKSELTNTLEEFQEALSEAVKILGAENADVSIVYEAHELSHTFVQVPPLSSRNLNLYLNNRAEQEKVSDQPILYSFRRSLKHRDKDGALLHIINKNFVDRLVAICYEEGLFPVKLVPLSEIMEQEMFRFSPEKNDVVLMLAAFAEMTEILVARGDGKILFLRDLNHSATHGETSRLVTEIKRSILYANQQFHADVKQVGIIGEGAGDIANALQGDIPIPVHAASESVKSHFWAEEVIHLSSSVASNLLPIHVQFKRSSKFVSRSITFVLTSALLIAIGIAANVEYKIWHATTKSANTSLESEKMLAQRAELSHQVNATRNVEYRISELNEHTSPPIPAWFLSHLSSLLPSHLTLTDSQVKFETNQWLFSLQGIVMGKTSRAPQQLDLLETRLQSLGLDIRITQSWKETWLHHIQHGGLTSKPVKFIIEGTIQ